jgi:hypothetical protein
MQLDFLKIVFTGLLGSLLAAIAFYCKHVWSKIEKHDNSLKDIENRIAAFELIEGRVKAMAHYLERQARDVEGQRRIYERLDERSIFLKEEIDKIYVKVYIEEEARIRREIINVRQEVKNLCLENGVQPRPSQTTVVDEPPRVPYSMNVPKMRRGVNEQTTNEDDVEKATGLNRKK